jgi:putative spermidine/putrescine transport system ATP-binding protein
MRSELKRLQRQLNITMVVVTHDQLEALALADTVAVMQQGKLAQLGTPRQVYAQPDSEFVARFMGMDNVVAASEVPTAVDSLCLGERSGVRAYAWRPNSVVIGTGPHQGKIAGASYLGDAVELLIDSPLGAIKAQAAADAPWEAGDSVNFDLPLDRAVALSK